MIEVFVFEGGEYVDETSTKELDDWSEASIIELLSTMYDSVNDNEDCTGMFADDGRGSIGIRDTLKLVSDNLAHIVADGYDGGMIYVVRK